MIYKVDREGRLVDPRKRRKDKRPSAHKRGYGPKWQVTRRRYLRDHPLCETPGCKALAIEVHHRDGLGPNGPLGHVAANLKSFCKSHHAQLTAREQPGGWAA